MRTNRVKSSATIKERYVIDIFETRYSRNSRTRLFRATEVNTQKNSLKWLKVGVFGEKELAWGGLEKGTTKLYYKLSVIYCFNCEDITVVKKYFFNF